MGVRGGAREAHLHGTVVIVQQPAQHVQLVDQGVGDRHIGGVVLADRLVAVGAAQHQRRADIAIVDHFFQRQIAFVVRAHKANLHQTTAGLHFGIDDAAAAFRGHRQRFFAEYRLTGGDGGQSVLFVGRVPGGDQDGIDIAGVNHVVAVGVDFRLHARQRDRRAGVVGIDIRHRHNGGALQNLGAATDVFFTDSASADDT